MRIQASRLKYLAFVVGLGACFFDPKATGPGAQAGFQTTDGSVAGTEGVLPASGTAGESIGTGVAAMSGGGTGGSGASGSGGQNVGGMSSDAGPAGPQPLANGEACADDARCMSGHCDGVCCDKGSECCKTVADCTTTGGLGMSCDDRSMCRGSAGKITCTGEFKCITLDGARNDTACSNRVEANDCGLYPSVFCLGGELQQGAPPCATSCANDNECDLNAHCEAGKCEADKPNGQQCKRNEDCTAGLCKNMKNGMGVCCGVSGDCCATEADCPDMYRKAAACTEPKTCRGMETVAVCMPNNICASMAKMSDVACNGMKGDDCGFYQDITCMAGRVNTCKMSCNPTIMGECDANAYCDGRACVAKQPNGGMCTAGTQCTSNNCMNGVCCSASGECCRTATDCKVGLQAMCDRDRELCHGTVKQPTCEDSFCRYGDRVPDDRGCTGRGATCGNFKDLQCNGMSQQNPKCETTCTNDNRVCDDGFVCMNGGCESLRGNGNSGSN